MAEKNSDGQKVLLEDYTWVELERLENKDKLKFLLPVGATEEHGAHLRLGADSFQAAQLSRLAALRTRDAIVLPTLSYGHCVDTMNFCGTIHLSAATICSLVGDVAESLYRYGFRKLVAVNGHGGNKGVLDAAAREALVRLAGPGRKLKDDFSVYVFSPYDKAAELIRGLVEGRGYGHACEAETSVMLALDPEAVDLSLAVEEYMDGDSDTLWRIRDMQKAAPSGVHGAPGLASAEKGGKIVEAMLRGFVEFLEKI